MSTAAARRDQVRQSRETTRARIVAAAATLLRERSYTELTVDEVMHEAGQGRTIFYRHFDDLADLIVRASREAIEALYDAQRMLGAEHTTGSIHAALALAVDVYERHGPLLRGVAEAAGGDPQIARGHAEMRRRFDDLAEQWLLAARGQAGSPPAGVAQTARALNLMNESYLLDAFGRAPRVTPQAAAQTLGEVWLAVAQPR